MEMPAYDTFSQHCNISDCPVRLPPKRPSGVCCPELYLLSSVRGLGWPLTRGLAEEAGLSASCPHTTNSACNVLSVSVLFACTLSARVKSAVQSAILLSGVCGLAWPLT